MRAFFLRSPRLRAHCTTAQKSLFHRNFCNIADLCALRGRACVQRCVKQDTRAENALRAPKCAPHTRFVKPDTVFFVVL